MMMAYVINEASIDIEEYDSTRREITLTQLLLARENIYL